jgi:hypothetical protein
MPPANFYCLYNQPEGGEKLWAAQDIKREYVEEMRRRRTVVRIQVNKKEKQNKLIKQIRK